MLLGGMAPSHAVCQAAYLLRILGTSKEMENGGVLRKMEAASAV